MASNQTFTCPMCLEEKNKSKAIGCAKCDGEWCTQCFKTYILHCRNDPPCPTPKCEYVFEISDLRSVLPQVYWNTTYKISRKEVLFNHEEVYKEATMGEIVKYRDVKILKKKLEELNNIYAEHARLLAQVKNKMQNVKYEIYYIYEQHILDKYFS